MCRKSKAALAAAVALAAGAAAQTRRMHSQLIIVEPGHFHATLLQKEMYPWLDRRVSVYAPLGPELLDYLGRIAAFNTRKENPTAWELAVHTSDDPMAEMLRERPGNIVVFTGKNRLKIDRILAALRAGLNVLADKPWIIASADLPKLEEALRLAREKKLAAYDIMTERYEVTSELQRELVRDRAIFGDPVSVKARSVHNVMKVVAGAPLRRPAWFFDIAEYGEGLADVGTHVVDLVQWSLFPDQPIDWRRDVKVTGGKRWPLVLSAEQFAQVTGERRAGPLQYFCNNSVQYTLEGRTGVARNRVGVGGAGGRRRCLRGQLRGHEGAYRDPAGRGAEACAGVVRCRRGPHGGGMARGRDAIAMAGREAGSGGR